jgi:hypothetical protein
VSWNGLGSDQWHAMRWVLQDRDGSYVADVKSFGTETIRYQFFWTEELQKAKVFTSLELWNPHDNLGIAVAFSNGTAGGVAIPV